MKMRLKKKIGLVTLLETITTVYPTSSWYEDGDRYVLCFRNHDDWLDCCRDSHIANLLDDYLRA